MFTDFREGKEERGREKETHQFEKNMAWLLPYVPWAGIKPAAFRCTGRHSNQLSHAARAKTTFYYYYLETEVENQKWGESMSWNVSKCLSSVCPQILPEFQK